MPYTEHKGHPSYIEDHDDTLKIYKPATRRQRGAHNMSLSDTLQRAVRTPTLYKTTFWHPTNMYTHLWHVGSAVHQMCPCDILHRTCRARVLHNRTFWHPTQIHTLVKRRQHGAPMWVLLTPYREYRVHLTHVKEHFDTLHIYIHLWHVGGAVHPICILLTAYFWHPTQNIKCTNFTWKDIHTLHITPFKSIYSSHLTNLYTPATRQQRGAPNMSLSDTLQKAYSTPTLHRTTFWHHTKHALQFYVHLTLHKSIHTCDTSAARCTHDCKLSATSNERLICKFVGRVSEWLMYFTTWFHTHILTPYLPADEWFV